MGDYFSPVYVHVKERLHIWLFTLYTGPKPPWPSIFSLEKSLVARTIVAKSKKGSSKSASQSSFLFSSEVFSVSSHVN